MTKRNELIVGLMLLAGTLCVADEYEVLSRPPLANPSTNAWISLLEMGEGPGRRERRISFPELKSALELTGLSDGNYGVVDLVEGGTIFEFASTVGFHSFPMGGTNTYPVAFDDMRVRRMAKHYIVEDTGGLVTIDWNAGDQWYIDVTTDLQITDINRPTDPGYVMAGFIILDNQTGSDIPLVSVGDWHWITEIPVTTLKAGKKTFLAFWWDGDEVQLEYNHAQASVQPVAVGGTGTILGEAVSPQSTVYYPSLTEVTNLQADLTQGSIARVFMNNHDVFLASVAGRGDDTNTAFRHRILVKNIHANTKAFGARDDIRKTWSGMTNIATGEELEVELTALDSTYTNNMLKILAKYGAPGSAPAEGGTVFDNVPMLAAYDFEDTTDASLEDVSGNGLTMTTYDTAATTPSVTGINGNAWQFGVSGWLTNYAASLKPSNGPMTVTGWFKLNSTGVMHAMWGPYNTTGNQRAWSFVVDSGNTWRMYYSYNGTGAAGTDQISSGIPVASGSWFFFAGIIYNSNYIKASVTPAGSSLTPLTTITLSGDLYDSVGPWGIGAYGNTSPINSSSKVIDELYVWDGELSTGDLEYLLENFLP